MSPRREPRVAASPAAADRLERGAASWVTLLIVLGVAAGAYAAWVFGPPWVLHYEVKQVVRDYGNRAIKDPNDERLVEEMVQKLRSLALVQAVDDAGRPVAVPLVDVRRQDIVWERTKEPPSLHVEFEYPRSLELPWLDRTLERTYRVDLTMDQARANWGQAR
jgi:hypothetical protein